MTSIGDISFQYCYGISFIIIGNNIKSIGNYAFGGCEKFVDVYCYSDIVPSGKTPFSRIPVNAKLHVPEESINDYKSTSPWSNFTNIVALTDGDPNPTIIKTIDNHKIDIIYFLNGRRAEQPSKGLFIKNGKKYVVH